MRYGLAIMYEDWIARWREGRIGFHEGHVNLFLDRHIARFAGCRRVLVPLCGKAEDLAFLAAHGHAVVGVELSEQAVREFFAAHALAPSITSRGPFIEYRAGAITLLVGDILATTPELVGQIDAHYDRAALSALHGDLRPGYVAHLRAILPASAPSLIITLEYDQQHMVGPPFAVFESELRSLYAGRVVELLDERPMGGGGKCTQSGVPATERCFLIRTDDRR